VIAVGRVAAEKTLRHASPGLPIRSLRIEVTAGPDVGRTFVATSDTISVGTAPGNDLVLTDETVSRYHLELRRREDRISVLDHGSTNGTALGAAWIERVMVPAGTSLALGRSKILIDDASAIALDMIDDDRLGRIRGRSTEMRTLMARIEKVAESDVSVLLLGETGTGKEVIAHAIHEASRRRDQPFETVDCGALIPTPRFIARSRSARAKAAGSSSRPPPSGRPRSARAPRRARWCSAGCTPRCAELEY